MKALIEFLTLESVSYTLKCIEEHVKICNIENHYSQDKYISVDVFNNRIYKVNFYGKHENLYFQRIGNSEYYERVLIA